MRFSVILVAATVSVAVAWASPALRARSASEGTVDESKQNVEDSVAYPDLYERSEDAVAYPDAY
ncbi:hypothetical protein VTN96DRAFT_3598 [Rasamsonia emersonii]